MFWENSPLRLKAVTITLLALILLSTSAEATEEPDHSKATITSTVIEVQDGDTIELANGMEPLS